MAIKKWVAEHSKQRVASDTLAQYVGKMRHLLKTSIKRMLPQRLERWRALSEHKKILTSSSEVIAAIGKEDEHWRKRIDDVKASPDNALIPRCADAGQLDGYAITMHNGVKVCAGGYYGVGILNMLVENKGVHEPQEERVFEDIIRTLPSACCMLELGSYWGFYSLSLLQVRPKAKCFLVEPDPFNMLSGKLNFRLNKRKAVFRESLVGDRPSTNPRTSTVDSLCEEFGIKHLNILHSDIQGHELSMLKGAHLMLERNAIDFVFISTHSQDLHADCSKALVDRGYRILCAADLEETFSYDGLIVAASGRLRHQAEIKISKKLPVNSLPLRP
jgi:hypothetical protein